MLERRWRVPEHGCGGVLRHRAGEFLPVRAVAVAAGTSGAAASGLRDRRPADTGDWCSRPAACRLLCARQRSPRGLVAERDVRVVLYLNQIEANFRMLRFASPVHIQIGHGESDKGGSVSNQHKAYDLTFVGGDAGRDRLIARCAVSMRPSARCELAARSLTTATQAPCLARDSGMRVWYAPTWEGDRPSIAYGSLASHGVAIIEALLADPSIRIIYRPHARTGYASRKHRDADRAVRACSPRPATGTLLIAGYGWQWDFADACITDISAVAYDWLPTGKPLVITEPAQAPTAHPHRCWMPLLLRRGGRRGSGQDPRIASRSGSEGATSWPHVPLLRGCECSAEHETVRGCNRARVPDPTIWLGLRDSEPAQEVNVVVGCLRRLLLLGSAGRLRVGPTEQQPADGAG